MPQKQTARQRPSQDAAASTEPADLSNPELTAETEALLDEIDSVLEDDAGAFVANFIQRSGQ